MTVPSSWFKALTTIWLFKIETIIRLALKLMSPPAAVKDAIPIVWPIDILSKLNAPTLELKNDVDISGSLGSWETIISKSVVELHVLSAKFTTVVGENGIHSDKPVFPPTQLLQLSTYAEPPKSPLQSVTSIDIGKNWLLTSDNSELIEELKLRVDISVGLLNKAVNVTVWLFPAVTLLLSAGAIDKIFAPVEIFSNSKVPITLPLASSTALNVIWSDDMIKST